MRDYVKQARDEGLNWQAIIIEETEIDIKVLIKQAILDNLSFDTINKRVIEQINNAIEELEPQELKERSKRLLLAYATEQYRKLKDATRSMSLILLAAMALVYNNKKLTQKQAQQVNRTLNRSPTMRVMGIENLRLNQHTGYYDIGQALQQYSKDYMRKVEKTFSELARSTARDGYASNVSLRNIAEMTVRYENHINQLAELKEKDVNLVWISTHANCSQRCASWQGKLYSLDGTYGTIDGIKYQPLENATDIYYTTKAGKTYKNGIISGFNCRHYLIPYEKGNKPVHVPANIVERERKINDTQRELEREVRGYRDMALTFKGIDDIKAKQYRAKAIAKNKEYIQYSKKNKVAYYPSRTKIFDENWR